MLSNSLIHRRKSFRKQIKTDCKWILVLNLKALVQSQEKYIRATEAKFFYVTMEVPTVLIMAVLYCVVLVFNVTGNSLVIHIISRKQRSATDYLLLNLAVADLIFGIFLAPLFLYPMFVSSTVLHAADFTCRFPVNIGNISWIACGASLFTVTILTIERYFAVCRPHSFKRYFSIKNVKRLLVVGWLLSNALQTIRIITDKCQNEENDTKVHSIINAGMNGFLRNLRVARHPWFKDAHGRQIK